MRCASGSGTLCVSHNGSVCVVVLLRVCRCYDTIRCPTLCELGDHASKGRTASCVVARSLLVDQKANKCWMHTMPGSSRYEDAVLEENGARTGLMQGETWERSSRCENAVTAGALSTTPGAAMILMSKKLQLS